MLRAIHPAASMRQGNVLFGASAEVKDFPELGGKGTRYDGVVILDGRRTPFGEHAGSLATVNETDLAIAAAKGVLDATGISPKQLSDSIWGNVIQSSSEAAYLARNVMLALGAPVGTVATTINKLCGSGLKAIEVAAKDIGLMKDTSKDYIVLAGGTESMSNAPFGSFSFVRNFMKLGAKAKKLAAAGPLGALKAKRMFDNGKKQMAADFQRDLDRMISGKAPVSEEAFRNTLRDGLSHARAGNSMIDTSENLRERFHLTPEQLDQFSVESQHWAARAIDTGKLKEEIVPVIGKDGKVLLAQDEGVRGVGVKAESLQKLRARQAKKGSDIHMHPEKAVHTAANASRIVDGAAAVLVTNVETAERLHKKALGNVLATAEAGVNPKEMGYGAAQAAKVALKTAGLDLKDIDLIEVNEAFAGVAVGTIQDWAKTYNLNADDIRRKTNVNGGAIALGHPLGATGARLGITLLKEMQRRNVRYGLATACIGGGQGMAMIVENPDAPKGKKI